MLGIVDVARVEQGRSNDDFRCNMGEEVDLRAKRKTGFFFLAFPGGFVATRFLFLRVLSKERFSVSLRFVFGPRLVLPRAPFLDFRHGALHQFLGIG